MRIKVTEIECDANELRQSNSLSCEITNFLKGVFCQMTNNCDGAKEDEDVDVLEDNNDKV